MNAIVRERYGALELRELPPPGPTDGRTLVRIHASSVNPVDWYELHGRPYVARPLMGLRRPKIDRLGGDFAGIVESTGEAVFGVQNGAFAEYVAAKVERLAPMPANLSFEQAAAVPIAGITALQALRDKGGVRAGQHVLVNGASGGVGTFAVQIAKALGAEVTGVVSTGKVEQTYVLGADHVVDYTRDDFTRTGGRYDLIVDIAGSRSFRQCRRVLAPGGTFVVVGGPKTNRLLGPLGHSLATRVTALGAGRTVVPLFIAQITRRDLLFLNDLIKDGKVAPVVERSYELREVADALRYLGEGHARGKIVVSI